MPQVTVANADPAATAEPVLREAAGRRLEMLLLCDYHPQSAGTIIDHIEALRDRSRHKIRVISSTGDLPKGLELDRFDGIIIHYSLTTSHDTYISPRARAALRSFGGLKIAFVQDDYRFINRTIAAFMDIGVKVIFGLAPDAIIDDVYPPAALPGVRRETLLAGYIPERLLGRKVPLLRDRPIDIGYRGRKLPAWLGSHAQEKWIIAERVLADAPRYGLTCDISTDEYDRIYGERWIDFMLKCKAMLGVESGSSICDFTGEIQRKVEAHLARDPHASFELLRRLYFKDEDGRLMMNVISPRCFEAAALKTLMILYEGDYSGRLTAWRHYVPLAKDHSNTGEVASALRDVDRSQEIVERAYQEVALNLENSFGSMVAKVDEVIDDCFTDHMSRKEAPHTDRLFADIERAASRKSRRRGLLFSSAYFIVPRIEAALNLMPAAARIKIHAALRQIWRMIIGVETPLSQWGATSIALIRSFGVGPYLQIRSIRNRFAGVIDESLYQLGLVLRKLSTSDLANTRISYAPAEEAVIFVTQDGVSEEHRRPPAGDIRDALAKGAVRKVEWRLRKSAPSPDAGVESIYRLSELGTLAKADPASAAAIIEIITAHIDGASAK